MSSTPAFPPRRRAPVRRPLALCLAAALLAPVLMPAAARAGAPAVSNCNDSGAGSLRAAVAAAGSGDVIELGGLACSSITLSSGEIQVNGIADLSIRANAAQNFSIVGSGQDRVFAHVGAGQLSLANLAIRDGRSGDAGGCVYSQADLRLDNVTLSHCAAGSDSAQGARGGAAAAGNTMTINASRILDNQVDGTGRVFGGGVWAGGLLSVTDSEFRNNHAHSHAGPAPFDNIVQGGAIHADLGLSISGSQIIGNTALSDSYEVYGGGFSAGSRENGAEPASLSLVGSTVSGNTAQTLCDVCAPQGGGGIVVGNAQVRSSTVSDNIVTSTNHYGGGGGLRFFGEATSAEISDSIISGNQADSAGGGLIGPSRGVLRIERTRIEDNEAGNQAGIDEAGGGILTFGGAVELIASSVTGNVSGADGGGINVLFGEYAPTANKIINSTISGNSAREGGAICLSGGDLEVSNSTIALNTATRRGAGVSADEYTYQIDLQSSIIAGNTTNGAANNVWAFPDVVSGADNLIPNAPGLPAEMPADTLTADPQLLPLAANGGPTLTHALGKASPAIDAGNNKAGLVFDQRGANWLRGSGAGPDIGAFEAQPTPDILFQDSFDSQ